MFVCLSVTGAAFIPLSQKQCLRQKVTTDFTLNLRRHQLAVQGRDFRAVRKFGFFLQTPVNPGWDFQPPLLTSDEIRVMFKPSLS